MIKWVLIIWISSDLWLPVAAYDTEDECYAALQKWEIDKPDRVNCVRGEVEPEKQKPKRKRRN